MKTSYCANAASARLKRACATHWTFPRCPCSRSKTHLPVVIDPSHAAGIAWMVEPLAMAAIAAGADGLMIEVHNDPPHAKSDGAQSLTPAQFDALMGKVKAASAFFGKAIN